MGTIGGRDNFGRGGMNDPLYLAQLQKDKDRTTGEEVLNNPKSKIFALTAATLYFKKFIDHFVNVAKSLTTSINTDKALTDLREFKKLLDELRAEDKGHNPEYTQRLSHQWQHVYENCSGLEDKVGHLDTLASEILKLIKEIDKYPPGEDFTLGYYLTEHAGQEWIPFPFMKLLSSLHEEDLENPEKSKLGEWVRKINEIIGLF